MVLKLTTSQIQNKKIHDNTNRKSSYNNSLYDYIHPAIKPSESNAKTTFEFTNWKEFELDDFKMPGTNEAHADCQQYKTIGCINKETHKRKGYGNKDYIKRFCKSCGRLSCKKCFLKAIGREADRASKRFKKYSRDKPIHIVLSPPENDSGSSERVLRKKAHVILGEANVRDGALVYHPARPDYENKIWYPSPHYHFVGFGWLRNIQIITQRYGWRVIYKGIRKTVFGTFCYLLSHCGVKNGRHSVTWIGKMSYGKLKVEKEPNSGKCPACGAKLVPIYYKGVHPTIPPDKEFEGFDESENWYPVGTEPKLELSKMERYEYVLNRELYRANKGIDLRLS